MNVTLKASKRMLFPPRYFIAKGRNQRKETVWSWRFKGLKLRGKGAEKTRVHGTECCGLKRKLGAQGVKQLAVRW